MFEKRQNAQSADLFPPLCVDSPCHTQSMAASNRLDWRKNLSPLGILPFIKQGLKYIKEKQWWDTIDGLDKIVGNIAFVDERINNLMLEWSTDDDFGMRRIAIDHQLCRKDKTNTQFLRKY